MVEVRLTTPEAKERFRGRTVDMLETFAVPDQVTRLAFWRGDTVLALFEGRVQWPGVAFIAGSVSDDARGDNAVILMRLWRRMLLGWSYEQRLRRVSGYIHEDRVEYQRFARLMGFEREAVMAGAAPDGADLLLFTRHFEWTRYSAGVMKRRRHQRSITARCGTATRDG